MGKLYDTYFPAINGIICRLTTKNKLVENILEIGFINAWQQIDSFNPTNGSIFTWLLKITRKTAFEAIKAEAAQNYGATIFVGKLVVKKFNKEASFDLVCYKGFTFEVAAIALDTLVATIKASVKMTMQ